MVALSRASIAKTFGNPLKRLMDGGLEREFYDLRAWVQTEYSRHWESHERHLEPCEVCAVYVGVLRRLEDSGGVSDLGEARTTAG